MLRGLCPQGALPPFLVNLKNKMKIDIKYLKELIKEQQKENKSVLLVKPPNMDDIKKMVSEVLEEMVGENDKG